MTSWQTWRWNKCGKGFAGRKQTACFFQLRSSRRVQVRNDHVTFTAWGESSGLVVLGGLGWSRGIRRPAAIMSCGKIRSAVMMQMLRGADWPSRLSIPPNVIPVRCICQRDAAQLWLLVTLLNKPARGLPLIRLAARRLDRFHTWQLSRFPWKTPDASTSRGNESALMDWLTDWHPHTHTSGKVDAAAHACICCWSPPLNY